MDQIDTFDVVVIGGGPSGATAATDLARRGHSVLLLDKAGRTKPCGGAIPPRAIRDFEIPDELIVAKVTSARIISPAAAEVDMPIDKGYVGMVDRDVFDEWLRCRAATSGATRRQGTFEEFSRDANGAAIISYRTRDKGGAEDLQKVRARSVIGADGALSAVARLAVPGAGKSSYVFAYHEIIAAPEPQDPDAAPGGPAAFDSKRCDVIYNGKLSPDFYSWIFPHGKTISVGTGTAHKGFSMRDAVGELRAQSNLSHLKTIRREGAPIPLKPLRKWDNGRDVVLAGDAAGVVAPASGEGIYYAMFGGRLAADVVDMFLETGDARALSLARKRFMKQHRKVFWVLGMMQHFWYRNDNRRERFVHMCRDKDIQYLTWQSYMEKELVRQRPIAHVKIFFKDLAQLFGLATPS